MAWSKGTFMGKNHVLILQTGVLAAFSPKFHELSISRRFGSIKYSEMLQLLWIEAHWLRSSLGLSWRLSFLNLQCLKRLFYSFGISMYSLLVSLRITL